jgi:primosomal protein N' (replication factor Y)
VSFTKRQVDRDPFGHASTGARREVVQLTSEQAQALDQLRAMTRSGRFAAALLHGVTGSGKTELYL